MSSFKWLYCKFWKDTTVLVNISVGGFLWCVVYDSSAGSLCKLDQPGSSCHLNASTWLFVHIFQKEEYSYDKLNILAVLATQFLWICLCMRVYEIQHFSVLQAYTVIPPISLEGVMLPLLPSSLHCHITWASDPCNTCNENNRVKVMKLRVTFTLMPRVYSKFHHKFHTHSKIIAISKKNNNHKRIETIQRGWLLTHTHPP